MDKVIVRPVIELSVFSLAPPPDSDAGKLAADIRVQTENKGYTRFDPDAGYVPLADLKDRIGALASYLLFETAAWGDFEISGGFEIVLPDSRRVGVTPGSSFRDAVGLAQAISNLSPENSIAQAFIENDRYFDLTLEGNTIKITRGHTSRGIDPFEIYIPAQELKDGMADAHRELRQFAEAIEPLLISSTNPKIPPSLVRFMFGLA